MSEAFWQDCKEKPPVEAMLTPGDGRNLDDRMA